jgi:4-hydroxy-tetrahydrodipicolinate synthase
MSNPPTTAFTLGFGRMAGVHTALVTPFWNGDVDLPAFERLLDRQLRAGVAGVVVAGTTGETPTLEENEWESLVATTVRICAGRVPVTAGTGTNATRSTVRRTEKAKMLGATAALVVLPYYNKPNLEGHKAHVEAAAAAGLPLVLYHVPGRTGQRVAPEALAELCAIPGVAALKEATGDLAYANHVLDRVSIPVLSGDDFTFLPLGALGACGVISVLSNIAPRSTVACWDALVRGDLPNARRRFFALLPVIDYLFAVTSPLPCKAMLAAAGLCQNEARLPLSPIHTPVPEPLLALLERD